MDAVFHGGTVLTVDDDFSVAEAVAVRDGWIVKVGSEEDVLELQSADTEAIDLDGGTLLPGFNDCHVHLGIGDSPEVHDWTDVEDFEELAGVVRAAADSLPEGTWIQGRLRNESFPEKRIPDRYDLDEIVTDHPIVLTRGAHVMILNSRGVREVGITNDTEPAPGGTIEFDETGDPSGVLREKAAWRLALEDIPRSPPPAAEARNALLSTLEQLPPLGITSINVAGVRPRALRHIQALYEQRERDLVRLNVQVRMYPSYDAYDDLEAAVEATKAELDALGVRTGFGDDRLKLGGVKMSVDGGFTGQAFWSAEPYPSQPDFTGLVRIPEQSFRPAASYAHRLGWQLSVHAIGDAAAQMVVRELEEILSEEPRADHRHFLHHVSVRPPRETLETMADLGISVCSQPNFAHTLSEYAVSSLEGQRLRTNNPQMSLARLGIPLAYGSDGMPLGPLTGIYAAVTRKGADGKVYGSEERMSVEDAIRAYTMGSAWIEFADRTKGSVEPGKRADFVVLEQNPLDVPPDSIKDVPVAMTVIDGHVVYRAAL